MASYKLVSPRIDTNYVRRASHSSHDSWPSGRRSSVSPIEPEGDVQDTHHDNGLAERPQMYEPGGPSDVAHDDNATKQPQTFESAAWRKSSDDSREKDGDGAQATSKRHRFRLRLLLQPSNLMFGLLLWGVLLAVGHHVVYQFLDGKLVASYSQAWIIRIATGVALLIKASWSIAVGVALQQTLWYTFRRYFVKIGSVDKLLTMEYNLLGFLSFDALKTAPTAVMLAVVMWLLPVVTVITPGTLSVVVDSDRLLRSATCQVPTFGEGGFNGAELRENGSQLMVFRSPQTAALTSDVVSGGSILPFASPCGANCSYEIRFAGPGFECKDSPNFVIYRGEGNMAELDESLVEDPRSVTPGIPGFSNLYFIPYYSAILGSHPDYDTIWIQYLNNDSTHHVPNTFRYDPYINRVDAARPENLSPLTPAQENATWQTMACTLHNTTYRVKFKFENGDMSTTTSKLSSNPLNTNKTTGAFPFSNSSLETLPGQYLGPAVAFLEALSGFVIGSVPYAAGITEDDVKIGYGVLGTEIANTVIASVSQYKGSAPDEVQAFTYYSWVVEKPFLTAIPELFTNITLSTLSISKTRADTICTSTLTQIVYDYRPLYLVLTYGLGLLATLLCIILGIITLRTNGSVANSSFSQIVRATGNPALHQVLDDRSQGPKSSLEQRIMYGETVVGDGLLRNGSEPKPSTQGKAAFGLQGQVIKLRRNGTDNA